MNIFYSYLSFIFTIIIYFLLFCNGNSLRTIVYTHVEKNIHRNYNIQIIMLWAFFDTLFEHICNIKIIMLWALFDILFEHICSTFIDQLYLYLSLAVY